MKQLNLILLIVITFAFSNYSKAQLSVKDVFDTESPLTYFGADFSHAVCYGEGTPFIAVNFANSINNVLKDEYEKYNLPQAFKKSTVNLKFELTFNQNTKIDEEKFFTYSPSDLNKKTSEDIQKFVSSYDLQGFESGMGVVFIVDYLNKTDLVAAIWVTFFDISTKNVVFTEKTYGKPRGFGLRNYWANTFEEIIKDINSSYYKSWKKKYVPSDKK